ncbi:alpha/beta fold hydrolase [Haloarchaeobius amylolyticus]|uniref:alpha/beta fold hydrolase n=1 Tax=Haloarchaeobius amylolyticus TaxID=1198296 RepID=UPI00226FA49E|nr:alpha/beta hydrolase [Haloarchaeobius amylolyticus]
MPRVRTNGVATYYERRGDGRPVVFIHGLGWDHRSWWPQMAALEEEYELVAYDYRGHGDSETGDTDAYTVSLLADDLRELVTELDLADPVLCAHSYGGLIAAEYAIQYPDEVAGIVFADARTTLGESTVERAVFRLQPVFHRLETVVGRDRVQRLMEFVGEHITDMEQGPDEPVPELGMTRSEYTDEVTESFSRDAEGALVRAGRAYVGASPTDFDVPVLYTYGELTGEVIAGKADRLARAPTDVRVREISNAGHSLMLEQPETFTGVLREFLADV